MNAPAPSAPPPAGRGLAGLKARLRRLVAEYGALAVGVFVVLSALVFLAVWSAVRLGWQPESAAGTAGTLGAAYIAYRLTLPLRVSGTVVLTPLVARLRDRLRRRPHPPA